jgi:hypothetical protein
MEVKLLERYGSVVTIGMTIDMSGSMLGTLE